MIPEIIMYGNQATGEIRFFADGGSPSTEEDWQRLGTVALEMQIEIGARERPPEIDPA